MTENTRLTTKEKYPHGAEGVSKDKLTGKYCRGVFEATACVEKLAEYETAEGEGRLKVLPCKVGDIIFCIVRPGIIRQFKVLSIEIYEYGVILELLYAGNVEKYRFWRMYMPSDDFGKKLFLTSEEAEEALKEMKK